MAQFPFDTPGNQEPIQQLLYRLVMQNTQEFGIGQDWDTVAVPVAGGSGFTPLPAQADVRLVTLINASNEAIDVQRANGTNGVITLPGTGLANSANRLEIVPQSNAGEILVRRSSQAQGVLSGVSALYQF